MSEKEDLIFLEHILEAIEKINKYLEKVDYKKFMENEVIQDAISRRLEIIGEATKLISKNLKKIFSEIPWKDIAGMRDKLIHGYFIVDLDEVWNTSKRDIPKLREDIKNIISQIEIKENKD